MNRFLGRSIIGCAVILALAVLPSRLARPQEERTTTPRIVLQVQHSSFSGAVSGDRVHIPQGPRGPLTIRRSRENPRPGTTISVTDNGPSVPEVWVEAPVTISLGPGERLWFDHLWKEARVSVKKHGNSWNIIVEPLPDGVHLP